MGNFTALFKKVNGVEQLKTYAYAHTLGVALLETLLLGFDKKSLEIVRLSATSKLLSRLRRKYQKAITAFCQKERSASLKHEHPHKIWMCWLQGIENAPPLVQKCFQSVQKNLGDSYEIVVITEQNYKNYVRFPAHIQQKIDSGIITKTHFSDLLRLELLNRYGGTWIDATVYLSGRNIPEYMLSSDLFLFQTLKPGLDGHAVAISSWFMTACSNHPILRLTQYLLYLYWEDHNRLVDYFLLHDFFQIAIETYPEEWAKVVPFSNAVPHILLLRLFQPYNEKIWKAVSKMTSVHKLSYKYNEEDAKKSGTYFSYLFRS